MAGFGQSRERAERLVALATILRRGRPVTLAQLKDKYRLYTAPDEESARRMFERDKTTLRDSGVEIATVDVDGTAGYVVAKASVTKVRWTEAELDTLAVLTTAIGDDAGGLALGVMAAAAGEFPAEGASASINLDVTVPREVAAALSSRRRLTMTYRNADGEERTRVVEPWDLQYRRGLLYLTAWDPDAETSKNFRVDRIVGDLSVGEPATTSRPDGPLPPVHPNDRVDLVIDVDADLRLDAAALGGDVVEQVDGRLRMSFARRRSEPMLSWALRTRSRIVDPADLAEEQDRRAEVIRSRHTGPPTPVDVPTPRAVRRTTLTTERLQRLLALPTWLGERAGATVDDMAAQFNCDPQEMLEDLDVLDWIDIPGIGAVGQLEERDGQYQYVRLVEEPSVELAAHDALRLLLAVQIGRAVLVADEAPALASIAQRLREIVPSTMRVELTGQGHPDLSLLKQSIVDGQVVRFDYKGRRDTAWRTRELRPEQLLVANGAVYVSGVDVVAGEQRMFRLDRLGDVVEAGEEMPALAADTTVPSYVAAPDQEELEVVLLLSTRATWMLTQLSPVAVGPRDDGGAVVVVRTDTTEWLLSHVRAAGGEAEVIAPDTMRAALATT